MSPQARGESNTAARLTWEQSQEIAGRYAVGGVSVRHLATEYGVSPATIYKIVQGKTWSQPGKPDSAPIASDLASPEGATGSLAHEVDQNTGEILPAKGAKLAVVALLDGAIKTHGSAEVAHALARRGEQQTRTASRRPPPVPVVIPNERFYDDPSIDIALETTPVPIRPAFALMTKPGRYAALDEAKRKAATRR